MPAGYLWRWPIGGFTGAPLEGASENGAEVRLLLYSANIFEIGCYPLGKGHAQADYQLQPSSKIMSGAGDLPVGGRDGSLLVLRLVKTSTY